MESSGSPQPAGGKVPRDGRRTTPPAEAALPLDASELATLQERVIAWFVAAGRDLPWRRTRDPWSILVSEVMLQQIQVVRAVPFYVAFLDRFPTAAALAAATRAEAIRVWGNLGRYKRVVALHRAARIIVGEHGGRVPSDPALLRALPGVGPYTAGAVACFAFGRDEAFLDTNLRRVIHRLFVGADVPDRVVAERTLQRLAAAAVPAGRSWEWHQGLMDLGATVCSARRPACERCPASDWCRARPAIGAAIAALPRRMPSAGSRFRYEDSNRYVRGRVLAHLRDRVDADGFGGVLSIAELGSRLRGDFSAEHVPWLTGVIDSLAKDGLAVAEERPVYEASSAAVGEREVIVRLPE